MVIVVCILSSSFFALISQENEPKMIDEMNAKIQNNPNDMMLYYHRGSGYFRLKDYYAAEKDFDKIINSNNFPVMDVILRYKARVLLLTNRENESIHLLTNELARKTENRNDFYYQRALGYDYIDDYDRAVNDYYQFLCYASIKWEPHEFRFGYRRYVTLKLLRKDNDVGKRFDKFPLETEKDYEFLYLKSYYEYSQKQYEKAKQNLEKVLVISPQFNTAYVLNALIAAQEKKDKEVITNMEKAVLYGFDEAAITTIYPQLQISKEIENKISDNEKGNRNTYKVYKQNPLLLKIDIHKEAELMNSNEY